MSFIYIWNFLQFSLLFFHAFPTCFFPLIILLFHFLNHWINILSVAHSPFSFILSVERKNSFVVSFLRFYQICFLSFIIFLFIALLFFIHLYILSFFVNIHIYIHVSPSHNNNTATHTFLFHSYYYFSIYHSIFHSPVYSYFL